MTPDLPQYETTRGDQWAGPAVTLTLSSGGSPVDFTGSTVECGLRDYWDAPANRYTFSGGNLVVTVTPAQGKIVVQPILPKDASALIPPGVYCGSVSVEKTPEQPKKTIQRFTLNILPK